MRDREDAQSGFAAAAKLYTAVVHTTPAVAVPSSSRYRYLKSLRIENFIYIYSRAKRRQKQCSSLLRIYLDIVFLREHNPQVCIRLSHYTNISRRVGLSRDEPNESAVYLWCRVL